MAVSNLGYFGITSRDPERWCAFATKALGMMRDEDDGRLLRLDGYAWRIAVHDGNVDDIAYAGFEVAGRHDLELLVEQLRSIGIRVREADPTLVETRKVTGMYQCEDPAGLPIELYFGAMQNSKAMFHSPQNACFVTRDQGLGHIVISAPDMDAFRRFYCEGLGFRLSDTMALRAGNAPIEVEFYHCNPRHHTLALVPMETPNRLHHFMVEVTELDEVGHARDRLDQFEGAEIARDIGRHSNDKVISFYARMPGGMLVEYGYGGVLVDDATWRVMRYDKASDWGHWGPSTLTKPASAGAGG